MPDRNRPTNPDDASEGGADDAALAIVARHALHDEELVAALAAGALDGADDAEERVRAQALVDRCPACRSVRDDVAAIVGATRAASTFTTSAPRDFRLSVDDAHRLGGTVITRGPFARLGRLVAGFARPLGASLAALGLVGVLVGGAALGSLGLGGASSIGSDAGAPKSGAGGGAAATSAPAAAPTSQEVAANPVPTPQASQRAEFDASSSGPSAEIAGDPVALLLVVSVLAVALGLGLFVYGTMAGRRGGSRTDTR